jgi:hypothetical protein
MDQNDPMSSAAWMPLLECEPEARKQLCIFGQRRNYCFLYVTVIL